MEPGQKIEIRIGPRTRAVGIACGVLAVALALVDFVVLRGEAVARVTLDLRDEEPAFFEVVHPGEPHVVDIRAIRRVKGETKGRSVDYMIVGPDGTVIAEESEFVQRKNRYVRFTPRIAGPYAISVSDDGLYTRGSSRNRTATVVVRVNDHRILPRLVPF
jgi:hypothetical protein